MWLGLKKQKKISESCEIYSDEANSSDQKKIFENYSIRRVKLHFAFAVCFLPVIAELLSALS